MYSTALGLLPGVIWQFRGDVWRVLRGSGVETAVVALFGLTIALLTPFVTYGPSIGRFLLYVYPIGGVVVPAMQAEVCTARWRPGVVKLVTAHVALIALSAVTLLVSLRLEAVSLVAAAGVVANLVLPASLCPGTQPVVRHP